VLVAAVVVIAVAAAAGGYVELRHTHTTPPGTAAAAPVRTQRTLALAIGPAHGPAVAAALLATDPVQHSGSVLLLPAQTLATVPGYGPSTVGGAFAYSPLAVPQAAISDLLGVTVDGTWRLTSAAFASLVNDVGGVQVSVDVRIVGAHRTVLLEPGTQRLDGALAVDFATYLGPGEPAQAETARLVQVLDGVLSGLPKTGVPELLSRLGAGSASTETPAELAAFLRHLVASDYGVHEQTVPLTQLDTGSATPALEVDSAATHAFVEQNLAASVPVGTTLGNNLVQVENNTGNPGLVLRARSLLDAAKLDFIGSQDLTPLHTVPHTVVLIFNTSPASLALGHRAAAALGLPASAVKVSNQANDIANLVVILGKDFADHR
jgi:anionic cell wall polymer biosynthesis LytR-Cps2A-Psr (LCP) family protein